MANLVSVISLVCIGFGIPVQRICRSTGIPVYSSFAGLTGNNLIGLGLLFFGSTYCPLIIRITKPN